MQIDSSRPVVKAAGVIDLDLSEAERFLKLLDSQASGFTFQTADDVRRNGKRGKRRSLAQVHHGSLARFADLLKRLNLTFSAAVYITINATNLRGRTAKHIVRKRAVWADLDHGLPKTWIIPPSIVVETSPGRFQAFWLLADDMSDADHLGVLRSIALCYGSDPGVVTVERVMRLPGFWHQKGAPFRVSIVEASGRRYTAADLMAAYPPIAETEKPQTDAAPAGDGTVSIEELCDALRFIDPEERPVWRNVGMGLKHACGEEGRALWDEWSMGSEKYSDAEQAKAWRSFGKRKGGKRVTAGTIFHLAIKGGWVRPKRSNSSEDFEDIMSNDDNQPAKGDMRGVSHDALALGFAEEHGRGLRHVSMWGRWTMWTATNWTEDQTMKVYDLARKIAREEARKHKGSLAKDLRSAATTAAIVKMAQNDQRLAAPPDIWDRDPWLLATPSGTIELKTGVMREARREDYITKTTAVAPGGKCPMWLKTLDTVFDHDQDLIAYMQRVSGYCLTGVTTEQVFFFAHGPGGNGKGTVLNTLKRILGDYSRVTEGGLLEASRHARHLTAIAELRGKRAVFSQETKTGGRWDETLVKSLTGGDPVTAHFMRQDNFEYVPEFKLLVSGNHKPQLRSVTEAMRRRLHLIPFTVTFREGANRVKDMEKRLEDEWPGILAWAIEGCLQWQKMGLAQPAAVKAATQAYFTEQDAMSGFLADNCMFDDPNAVTETGELFSRFGQWCDYKGKEKMSLNDFPAELEKQGFRRSHDWKTNRSQFRGIRLVPQPWMYF